MQDRSRSKRTNNPIPKEKGGCDAALFRFTPVHLVAAADALHAAVVALDRHGLTAAEPHIAVAIEAMLANIRTIVFAVVVMPIARLTNAHAADRRIDADTLGV